MHRLQHGGGEHDAGRPQRVAGGHPGAPSGTSTMTASRHAEVDVRVDLHLLEEVGVGLADARDLADGDALRDRASSGRRRSSPPSRSRPRPGRRPACARGRGRASRACRARGARSRPRSSARSTADTAASWSVRSWIRAVPRVTRVTMPDEPVRRDDGVVDPDAVLRAGCDDDRLRERARRAGRSPRPRRDRSRPGSAGRPGTRRSRRRDSFSWRANSFWIARWRRSRTSRGALRLGAGVEQAVGPAVRVTERLRDALDADRERPQHASRRPTARRTAARRRRSETRS